MERNRKQELENKKLSNKQNTQTDKNHINISVNIGNNDNLQEDSSVNIKESITKPIEQPEKKVDKQKIDDNEILIVELKGLIKEFNSKKQNLIEKRQDIPNDIFDLPDIELNSRQDIVNLIEVLKEKIKKLDMIRLTPSIPQSIQPSRPTTNIQTPSNIPFGFQTFTRQPTFPEPTRIPPRGIIPTPAPIPAPEPEPREPNPDEDDVVVIDEEQEQEQAPADSPAPEPEPRVPNPDEDDVVVIDEEQEQAQIPAISRKKAQNLEARKATLQSYMNLIKNTGRNANGFLINQREVRQILNLVEQALTNFEVGSITEEEADYVLGLYSAMDNANGLFPVAKAYYNIKGQGTLKKTDRLTLRPVPAEDKFITGRPAFYLFRNETPIRDTVRNVPIFFNEDGDIYEDAIDGLQQRRPKDEFEEAEPLPEIPDTPINEPIPEIETTPPADSGITDERRTQLLDWRNKLYTTNRNTPRGIVFFIDNEISKALNDPNVITMLDRANGNIPATIAYLNMDTKPINQNQIQRLVLNPVARTELREESNDAFTLTINERGVARDNNNQQILYNEYGDVYTPQDLNGESIIVEYPFRPSSRDDLGIPQQQTPQSSNNAKSILENRRDALIKWSIPNEDEKYRNQLLNQINLILQLLEDGDKITDIYVPVLSNSNYDIASALAYLKAYENSFNIPELGRNTIISMTPSTRQAGLNFLTINGEKYDREGDFLLLNSGFGERIKIGEMKIQGVARVNPEGFQGSDSFTAGRISNMEQVGSQNPVFYSIESIISQIPEFQDYYNQIRGGN